jgi:hypothetical protein
MVFTGQQIKDTILHAKSVMERYALCKRWFARNIHGMNRMPKDRDVVSICTYGCFMDTDTDYRLTDAASCYVTNFLSEKDSEAIGLANWNDEEVRTKEDVLTLFTEAAASVNVDAVYDKAGEEVSLEEENLLVVN